MFHFIFDFSYGNLWYLLIIFVQLETGMNTLPSRHKQCHLTIRNHTKSLLYLVKLKMAQTGRPLTAVCSVEPTILNLRRKSFSVPFVSFPTFLKILSAVFWQKIFYIRVGSYQKFIFKLNMVNFSMWTKVELSWFATCHSYDVIKQLSK